MLLIIDVGSDIYRDLLQFAICEVKIWCLRDLTCNCGYMPLDMNVSLFHFYYVLHVKYAHVDSGWWKLWCSRNHCLRLHILVGQGLCNIWKIIVQHTLKMLVSNYLICYFSSSISYILWILFPKTNSKICNLNLTLVNITFILSFESL